MKASKGCASLTKVMFGNWLKTDSDWFEELRVLRPPLIINKMLEISWEWIPLILLAISIVITFIANGFGLDHAESEAGLIMMFITAIVVYLNVIFYGILGIYWGGYWLIHHIKIV